MPNFAVEEKDRPTTARSGLFFLCGNPLSNHSEKPFNINLPRTLIDLCEK